MAWAASAGVDAALTDTAAQEEGAKLLQRLFAHIYAPERQYEHIWREGDLVIWDNYAIQHARTREADPADGRRVLQRVWFGEHGYTDQLEQLLKARATTG